MVYNIIGSTNHLSNENLFNINDELKIYGGKFNFEITQDQFKKNYEDIKNLLKNENHDEIAKDQVQIGMAFYPLCNKNKIFLTLLYHDEN